MSDALEERLASHLRALGDTVDDELPPPVDLEVQVVRRRRRERATRRWTGVSVAAAVFLAVITVAAVHGTSGNGSIRIATSSTTLDPVSDSLQPGTTFLSARGAYVISLDANGRQNATMVTAEHKDSVIKYARATQDHHQIWYLSLEKGEKGCANVVREDVAAGTSTIVTHAVSFDVSPDGSRLALYGAGDLARDHCVPVKNDDKGGNGRVVVVDEANGTSSAVSVGNVKSLRWSPDGSYLVVVSCGGACQAFQRIDVPLELGAPLHIDAGAEDYPTHTINSASIEFGPDGLYSLEATTPITHSAAAATPTDRIDRIDPRTFLDAVPVFSGGTKWRISQLIPTATGTYVIATHLQPRGAHPALYLVDAGRLVAVRSLTDPGTITPVTPLPASG